MAKSRLAEGCVPMKGMQLKDADEYSRRWVRDGALLKSYAASAVESMHLGLSCMPREETVFRSFVDRADAVSIQIVRHFHSAPEKIVAEGGRSKIEPGRSVRDFARFDSAALTLTLSRSNSTT
jgi:hypothetical protein